ncbi:MAG: alpha/beta fold hydrolase [Chthoniobacterales bacterium]
MRTFLERTTASAMDAVMCAMMNRMQWRLRHHASTREEFENYLAKCEPLTREEFYKVPREVIHPMTNSERSRAGAQYPMTIDWPSPVKTGFPENDTARALWFVGPGGPAAPTAIVLHALMSASDMGYRRLAGWFHAHGWNMIFPHLPFHYSRKPHGHAVTANLTLVGEGLRQAVVEARQLMAALREKGCTEFGLLGTSYGGWVASLLAFVEADFRFLTLIQPIIDVEHVTWESPAAAAIRRILAVQGIAPGSSERHAHLSSPLHGRPLTPPDRITLIGGRYDSVAPPSGLRELTAAWPGSQFVEVRQGHFGYAALAEAKRRIEPLLSESR